MHEFLAMHGYAAYVWPAYAVFVLTLLGDALAPVFQRRRTLAALRQRLRREAARRDPTGALP
jgi:heme exporter protein D